MNEAYEKSIEKRQVDEKKVLLEKLHEVPIIQVACKRAGVGRATFYRWRQEDTDFSKAVADAMRSGIAIINDLAESQLIALIRDKKLPAIVFWLRTHHPDYMRILETKINELPPKTESRLSAKEKDVRIEELEEEVERLRELTRPAKNVPESVLRRMHQKRNLARLEELKWQQFDCRWRGPLIS